MRVCVFLRAARLYVDVASKPTTSVNQPEQCHMQTLQAAGIVEVQAKVNTYCNEFSAWKYYPIDVYYTCVEKFLHRKQRPLMPENKSFLIFYCDLNLYHLSLKPANLLGIDIK